MSKRETGAAPWLPRRTRTGKWCLMSKRPDNEHMTTYKDAYDEMLDDCYGPVRIGSLRYDASRVFEDVDPTAYRCGFVDWTDSLPCEDCDSECSVDCEPEDEYAPLCESCAAERAEAEAEEASA